MLCLMCTGSGAVLAPRRRRWSAAASSPPLDQAAAATHPAVAATAAAAAGVPDLLGYATVEEVFLPSGVGVACCVQPSGGLCGDDAAAGADGDGDPGGGTGGAAAAVVATAATWGPGAWGGCRRRLGLVISA